MMARIRTAIDVLRNRFPGALAMTKADDIAISIHHHPKSGHSCQVTFFFEDRKPCGDAYRAIERIYEMNRTQL